jgi:hypothetical protein
MKIHKRNNDESINLKGGKKNKNNNKIQTGVAAMITTKNTHFPNVSTIHFFFCHITIY